MPEKTQNPESEEGPDILNTIGKTPLLELSRLARWAGVPEGTRILAKAEHLNPGGSGKDRIALALLEDAERRGLQPGGIVVESTSGNTGIALAQACAVKGYQLHIVASEKVSQEKTKIIEAYGAHVHRTPLVPHDHPDHYLAAGKRLAKELGGFKLEQFENPANVEVHEQHTGREILDDLEKLGATPSAFVSGVGTGGTLTGAGRTIKDAHPDCLAVLADPEGSVLAAGGSADAYLVEGIGDDHTPTLYDEGLVDQAVTVPDRTSFLFAKAAARLEGVFIGGSAGSHLAAACTLARWLPAGATIVSVLPDTGRNYLSTFFDPDWCTANGIGDLDLQQHWDPERDASCRLVEVVHS